MRMRSSIEAHLVTGLEALDVLAHLLHDATHVTAGNVRKVNLAQCAVCFAAQATVVSGRERARLDVYQQVLALWLQLGPRVRRHNVEDIVRLTECSG